MALSEGRDGFQIKGQLSKQLSADIWEANILLEPITGVDSESCAVIVLPVARKKGQAQ